MKAHIHISVFLLLVVFAACQKDITIEPPVSVQGEQLFIECILTPGQTPRVYLSKSLPFFDETVSPQELFARGATVSLAGPLGTEVLAPDSTFDKFRCRWQPYYIGTEVPQQGQSYELTVSYRGKTYSSKTTIDQAKVDIASLEYTPEFFDVYGGHDGVIMRFADAPGPGNFYRFQMDRMIDTSRHHAHVLDVLQPKCTQGELFSVRDLGRTIFSDENADGSDMELLIEVSFEYLEGDTAWVVLQSLDRRAAEFYRDLDKQLEAIFNPFVEPVFIQSQIEGTLGVFGSSVWSDSVLFVYPQDNP